MHPIQGAAGKAAAFQPAPCAPRTPEAVERARESSQDIDSTSTLLREIRRPMKASSTAPERASAEPAPPAGSAPDGKATGSARQVPMTCRQTGT